MKRKRGKGDGRKVVRTQVSRKRKREEGGLEKGGGENREWRGRKIEGEKELKVKGGK